MKLSRFAQDSCEEIHLMTVTRKLWLLGMLSPYPNLMVAWEYINLTSKLRHIYQILEGRDKEWIEMVYVVQPQEQFQLRP